MTAKNTKTYSPQDLKVLFEALNSAPSYLSKRYILRHMLGWSDEDLRTNMALIEEEQNLKRMGKTGGY
jgi:hypothetical protein